MKKIILTVVALLLVAGIGGGAYMFFGKSAEASVSPGDLSDQAKKAEADAKKAEADAKVAFVKMDPLNLPVVSDNGVVQIINISITLEAADAEAAKEVEKFLPRLKDAFIQDMYGALSSKKTVSADGIVEVNHIKERLNKVTARVLGPDKVTEVLLQAVQQRKV